MNRSQFFAICFLVLNIKFLDHCSAKLPPNIKICSRNDPNIAKCIIESVSLLQPRLANGYLSADFRIPPLEPLKLDNLIIDRGPNFQVYINNFVVTKGASNFIIDRMKVNLNEPSFDFVISLPRLEFNGKYNLKTRIAVILVQQQGDLVGVAENYKARVRLNGKKYQNQNGETYVHFDKMQVKIQAGATKIELKDLFKDTPTLGAISNSFVNENSQYFLSDIVPSLERSLASQFNKVANEIVKSASWDEMFPNY